MVVEPGGIPHQLVTGTAAGTLKFLDFRVQSSSQLHSATSSSSSAPPEAEVGVWKTVEAHNKGGLSAMAAHPYASLMATATTSQVCRSEALSMHRPASWVSLQSHQAKINGLPQKPLALLQPQRRVSMAQKVGMAAGVFGTDFQCCYMQVVKLWSPRGEQLGVIRAQTSFLGQRIGPINCLVFHPYRLLLASGGGDPIIAM